MVWQGKNLQPAAWEGHNSYHPAAILCTPHACYSAFVYVP